LLAADRTSIDHVAVRDAAHLEVGFPHGLRHGQLDFGDPVASRGLSRAGRSAGGDHREIGPAHEDQLGRVVEVGTLLEGHVVARTDHGRERVAERRDQAVVDVRPEGGVLEVRVHPRKR
jgi:hypothetical protein